MKLKRCAAASAALALAMSSVAGAQSYGALQTSSGTGIKGKTHVESAIGKCIGSVLGGALLGGLIGKAAGDAGKGALIGAGAGTIVCAILLKVASNKDKQEIRNAQLAALNSNEVIKTSWTTQDNEVASAAVIPTGTGSVVVANKGSIKCRSDDICMVGDGWYPKASILNGTVDPNAPRAVQVAIQGARSVKCRRTSTSVRVADQALPDGSDVACLVGDVWVTGDELQKRKIRESDIVI